MGGILQRSATQRDETGARVRKDKRQRRQEQQQWDAGFDQDEFSVLNSNENQDPNATFMKSYDPWNDQYDQKPAIHINDPPGAPRSYSPNYSSNQHDMVPQQWASSQDLHNSYHNGNHLPSAPSLNAHYDPKQQIHFQMLNSPENPSPRTKPHERSPKRVQFASAPPEQKSYPSQTTSTKPLQSTQSWGEPQPAVFNAPEPMVNRPMRLSNRSSVPRSLSHPCKPVIIQAPVQRPVYIGIDHQATLAERSRRITSKRHRKNNDVDHSDGPNYPPTNQQARVQFGHQAKHRKPTDSPRSDNELMRNQFGDPTQPGVSLNQRSILKSASATRAPQNTLQVALASNDNRTLRSRNAPRQQPAINNEMRALASQENRRLMPPPTGSPLFFHTETSRRRIEQSHSSSSVIRIPLSTPTRHEQRILSTMTSKTNISHTRI